MPLYYIVQELLHRDIVMTKAAWTPEVTPRPRFSIRAKEGLQQTPYQIPRQGSRLDSRPPKPRNPRKAVLLDKGTGPSGRGPVT